MKFIALQRHAKSSWADPSLADFDRPLNKRGQKAARLVGRELGRRGKKFDLILASPAVRVRETLAGDGDGYGEALGARFEGAIYGASAADILAMIRDFPEEIEAPLIIGHNPGLQRLATKLSGEDPQGRRERIHGKFPTAAVVFLAVAAERWRDVEYGAGEIIELIIPKELEADSA